MPNSVITIPEGTNVYTTPIVMEAGDTLTGVGRDDSIISSVMPTTNEDSSYNGPIIHPADGSVVRDLSVISLPATDENERTYFTYAWGWIPSIEVPTGSHELRNCKFRGKSDCLFCSADKDALQPTYARIVNCDFASHWDVFVQGVNTAAQLIDYPAVVTEIFNTKFLSDGNSAADMHRPIWVWLGVFRMYNCDIAIDCTYDESQGGTCIVAMGNSRVELYGCRISSTSLEDIEKHVSTTHSASVLLVNCTFNQSKLDGANITAISGPQLLSAKRSMDGLTVYLKTSVPAGNLASVDTSKITIEGQTITGGSVAGDTITLTITPGVAPITEDPRIQLDYGAALDVAGTTLQPIDIESGVTVGVTMMTIYAGPGQTLYASEAAGTATVTFTEVSSGVYMADVLDTYSIFLQIGENPAVSDTVLGSPVTSVTKTVFIPLT